MSRSYRKPYATDGYGGVRRRYYKRQASRAIRIEEDVPNGMAYKKFYCSWNIRDYSFYCPDGSIYPGNNPWKYRNK